MGLPLLWRTFHNKGTEPDPRAAILQREWDFDCLACGEVIIAFIVYHYNPNKYSMYTFTFLITSTTFAVTELGHN